MSTIRLNVGCASLLLALSASAQEPKEKKPEDPPKPAELVVPSGAAPKLDGKLEEGEWKGAARFKILRGKNDYADVWVRRQGRQLHFACDSRIPADALGLRLNFTDPVSGQKMVVLVAPMNPPRSPLTIFRIISGRPETRVPAVSCDLRFDLGSADGFTMELRLPLDLLEVARAKKDYRFSAEYWDLASSRIVGGYPVSDAGPLAGVGVARLVPDGDWGADVPLSVKAPPSNEALALLEQVESSAARGPGILQIHTGHADGQRKDGPLEKLEQDLTRLIQRYPGYLSLHTNLVRVLRSRNRFPETLKALNAIPEAFPFMKGNKANGVARIEVLYVTGRFEEGLKLIEETKKRFADFEHARLERLFRSLATNWKLEEAIRAEEAKRDDLPRVRFKTNRGSFVMELFEDDTPNGVANMIQLVENGFYDGTRFHWVSGGGRVVGGDPNSRDDDPFNDGFGDPGYLIESEPGRRLQFPFTVAYMDKRDDRRRTEGCVFMIHITPLPGLDGTNSVIGRIIDGHAVVLRLEYYDRIEKAEVVRKRPHEYKVIKRP